MASPVFYGNVHFMGVARMDRGEGCIMASYSHGADTNLEGVKAMLQQPNIKLQSGKHYNFSSGGLAWFLIADETGIIFMLICALSYSQRCAFMALDELQRNFNAKFKEKASTAKIGSLDRAARPVLENACLKYDNVAAIDKLAAVGRKVEAVKLVMQENVDQALSNCVKLESIERATEELQQQAGVFKHNAKELKKKMWWKKIKMQLCIAFIVLAIIGGIIGIIVYMTDKDKKD